MIDAISLLLNKQTSDRCDDSNLTQVSPPISVLGCFSQHDDNPHEYEDVDRHHQHYWGHEEVHSSTVVQETAEITVCLI